MTSTHHDGVNTSRYKKLYFQLNHLSGIRQRYIKLSFISQNEMMKVRREILTAVNKNKEREKKDAIYSEMLTNALTSAAAIEHAKKTTDHMENVLDIR